MGFIGKLCLLASAIFLIFVCFVLSIITLFVNREPDNFSKFLFDDTTKNTAWSTAESSTHKLYCNAYAFKHLDKDTERNTMIAMVSLGFAFLVFFLLTTPCLLIDKLSGRAMASFSGVCGFLSWVFYLVAWAYWAAKDPCKDIANSDHKYGPGFGCAVALWCLLTLALPTMLMGACSKSDKE